MSLRTRLLAAFAYVLVLVIVALEVPLALNLSRRVDAEVKSEAQSQAALIASTVSGRLGNGRELERVLAGTARDLGGRVIVVNARGRLLADSAGEGLESSSYASRPEIADALRGRAAQGTRHSDTLGEDLLFTAVPVLRNGQTAGAVRVTQSVDDVQSEVRTDVLALIAVGVVALLLGLGVAWLLAGSLAEPLRGLARTARRVAGGDLEARAKPEGSSEQREVAAAFNEMTGRLGRSLRAQREFVANASHQLRTPLTGLRLRLEAAGLRTDDPEVRRQLEAAERETERLAHLLGQLLSLAREPDGGTGERLLLAEEAESALGRWEGPARSSGHELEASGHDGAAAEASRADVAAMLDNLIENALNYSPAGTSVTIETGGDAAWVWFAVCDRGPGVSPEEGERLFERFYRGSGSTGTEGTGLGLAVVEALAKRWSGEATLRNRDGGGARAEVRLPAAGLPTPDRQLDEALPGGG
ncbi:MAG: HAMP domain-containing protein [Thermoleophilaceae bacterium]|nr:HAMP domain-containing protein [Thermoleophilaceae bacterium]